MFSLEKLVVKTLQESRSRETLKAVLKGVQQDVELEKKGDYFEVLNAPYVRGFFGGTSKEIKETGYWFCSQEGREDVH